ncbi:MAG: M20/M25/M40 family metallo-hydrolase [Anaerolineae bacterium]|nr:M20/M25/M40 family metallo-hydrolase [Anaerolineae bacterium]NIN96170.1 M20/M25/M40 family metallo-hydrolase [Anaerolineae bacterium]NIQ78002.1 M20/M25/M40 family metallo-hydrolase [Anaerolineae bacterium]
MTQNVLGQIYDYVDQYFDEHLAATQRYLRQPSISSQNLGIEECAEMTAGILRELGSEATLVPLEGGHPVVYGHLSSRSSDRTLLVYGMYDVQPVEPLDAWESPPFQAQIVGDRIIGRGAYNTKGPLMAFLNGIRSIQAVAGDVPVNMVFVIEGEEELGSKNLPQFIENYADELQVCEGMYFHMPTEFIRGSPLVLLGCKGVAYFELEVKTLPTDAHSMTAPVVRNPVWRLISALGSMRGAGDRILIDGFYEDVQPPSEEDEKLLPELVDTFGPGGLEAMYGIKDLGSDLTGVDFVRQLIFGPSLNIDGFAAGHTGSGIKTIVPASAMCKVDIRLVPDMTVQQVMGGVRAHLDHLGYEDIEIRLLAGYNPAKTSMKESVVQAAVRSIQRMGIEPKVVPMIPSSGPQVMFSDPPLNVPLVISGLGHGWLMHAPNEYIEVEGLRSCEKSAVAFLYEFGAV